MHTETFDYADGDVKLEGYLAYDNTIKGKRPCVLVSHAWGGLGEFERGKAEALAQLGYVGFALDMYGKGKRGSNPDENMKLMKPFMDDRKLLRQRINAAANAMRNHLMVDASKLGAIGFCFGGLCAIDLARSNPQGLRGVVAFHGLLSPPKLGAQPPIAAKVLAMHGYDDPMAPPEQVLAFGKEMTDAKADWQLHAYGNTVHGFTNPQANMKDMGIVYNANADKRSWVEMKNFFEEVFE